MPRLILANSQGAPGIPDALTALKSGRSALDVVEKAIRPVESDPAIRTVGYGGAPNMLGEMELDASIMNGDTLQTGSVGALVGFAHPISVARGVMERLPHVLLVGAGAARFAREIGAEEREMLSPEAKRDYEKWLESVIPADVRQNLDLAALAQYLWDSTKEKIRWGTTIALVIDAHGKIAGGASTSGWAYRYPGRLGDSPIIGAGLYVDTRYGGAACTHTGEMTIRAGTARSVVLYMKKGASVADACAEAEEDLRHLKGGRIGPVTIYAIDPRGNHCALAFGDTGREPCCVWKEGMAEVRRERPEPGE